MIPDYALREAIPTDPCDYTSWMTRGVTWDATRYAVTDTLRYATERQTQAVVGPVVHPTGSEAINNGLGRT